MKKLAKVLALGLFLAILGISGPLQAQNASLLPNGQQQFTDSNGTPLSAGVVYFYVPNSTTPKNTWKDPTQTTLNSNPVILDGSGRATIYGSGQYRQVVQDSLGNTIWDQLTQGAGNVNFTQTTIASGTTVDLGLTGTNNVCISGTQPITSFGNSASLASPLYFITFCGSPLIKNSSQLVVPGGKDLQTSLNGFAIAEYNGSNTWTMLSYHNPNGQTLSMSGGNVSIAGSSTTDLGSTLSNLVTITGSASINGLGSSASLANPLYFVDFAGVSTLVNSGTLILQGGANITTAAGGQALAEYLGSGSWRVLVYNSPSSGGGGGGGSSGAITSARSNLVKFLSNTTLTMTVGEIIAKTAPAGTAYFGSALSGTLNFGSTGANGLDTGSIAASTFYGIYWIYNPSGAGTWATLASLSFTAPTLPSGYTAFNLVGVVPTNSSSQIVAGFLEHGQVATFQPITIFSGGGGQASLTSVSIAAAVPSIAVSAQGVFGSTTGTGGGFAVIAADSGGTGQQNTVLATPGTGFGYTGAMPYSVQILTPQTIFFANSTGGSFKLNVTGFGL